MHWTIHLEGGPRRVNHAAVAVKDKIYSFGGYCTGEDYKTMRPIDIHVLDTCIYLWRELPVPQTQLDQSIDMPTSSISLAKCGIPFRRYGHTAIAYEEKVYIWGGRNDDEACNTLFCFNTTTLKWEIPSVLGIKPSSRDGHSACLINDKMYIFGGYDDGLGRFSQDTYALDFKTMTWRFISTFGDKPCARDFHSATALGNRMYVFGGRGGSNVFPNPFQPEVYDRALRYLDTETDTWHTVIPKCTSYNSHIIPFGRRSLSAFAYKGNLYIFGGYNSLMNMHFNDLYMFETKTESWNEVQTHGPLPTKRRRQQCIVVNDRLFLFGGTSPTHELYQQFPEEPIEEEEEPHLIDHSDLHILDFAPSLQVLCLLVMINKKLHQPKWLPPMLKSELFKMTSTISCALNSSG